jgi:predicted nucleotidyltransferase
VHKFRADPSHPPGCAGHPFDVDNSTDTCIIIDMMLESPLAVITPTVDGDVLAVLARAEASFTPPHVRALIGRHSVDGVRKALNRLVEHGIVDADRVGNAVSYRLNRDHLAAGPIIELANVRTALFDRIRDRVETWSLPARLVMLFGSAATATMRTDSDIDLFIVGDDDDVGSDAWQGQVGELEHVVSRWTGNDARVLEYGVCDLEHLHDPVVDDIRRDGILISGDRSLLNRNRRNTS